MTPARQWYGLNLCWERTPIETKVLKTGPFYQRHRDRLMNFSLISASCEEKSHILFEFPVKCRVHHSNASEFFKNFFQYFTNPPNQIEVQFRSRELKTISLHFEVIIINQPNASSSHWLAVSILTAQLIKIQMKMPCNGFMGSSIFYYFSLLSHTSETEISTHRPSTEKSIL